MKIREPSWVVGDRQDKAGKDTRLGFCQKGKPCPEKNAAHFFYHPLPTQPELKQPGGGLLINFPELRQGETTTNHYKKIIPF